jgi:hypothetical protein|eukprot:COSAG01_NODE_4551_length_4930_cov_75.171807_6_plen_103_part_00
MVAYMYMYGTQYYWHCRRQAAALWLWLWSGWLLGPPDSLASERLCAADDHCSGRRARRARRRAPRPASRRRISHVAAAYAIQRPTRDVHAARRPEPRSTTTA